MASIAQVLRPAGAVSVLAASSVAAVIHRALEQLRSHRPSCRCGLCGETVANVKADRVYRTASIWQRSAAASRVRMAR